ncbi:head decoration protein [Devosia riboflavina]|uniref:head decoration protein n=1 Tax=Devosia riboflavina TaxID=46914 RepID=UPI00068AFB23|nr:head decoration protein [Devosia riboflavina]
MFTAPLTTSVEGAGYHIVSEEIYRSREQIMLLGVAAGWLAAGTVLGKIRVGDINVVAKAGGNTGNGTVSAVTAKKGAKAGTYRVDFTAATKFDVVDPEGYRIKSGSTGTAYNDDLGFTITAGGNAFVAGDAFDIVVELTDGAYGPLDLTAGNGLEEAVGVLWEGRNVVLGEDEDPIPVRAVANIRETEVHAGLLVWPEGITAEQQAAAQAQLAARHVILRSK